MREGETFFKKFLPRSLSFFKNLKKNKKIFFEVLEKEGVQGRRELFTKGLSSHVFFSLFHQSEARRFGNGE